MAKRKRSTATQFGRKRRKTNLRKKAASSCLPEVFADEEQLLGIDDFNDSSLLEDSVLLTDSSKSDEELDELPQGLSSLQEQKDNIKTGDIVWIKHSAKDCFWPAFVKEVSSKHIKVFYIGWSRFTKGEKTFRYNAKSNKVKQFCSSNNQVFIEKGRQHCKLLDTSLDNQNFTGDDHRNLSSFNKALDLAETYMLEQGSRAFSNEQDIFEFFRSDGISLCHKKCVEEQTASSSPVVCATIQTSPVKSATTADISSMQPDSVDSSSSSENLSPQTTKNNSKWNVVDWFNSRNSQLVNFIVAGNCDHHLQSVINGQICSDRMCQFTSRWEDGSEVALPKTAYFEDDLQLSEVCSHLRNFISNCGINCQTVIKQDDLLFSVLLPEACIYGICKVCRRKRKDAEKMYANGCQEPWRISDPELNKPLTDEDRCAVQRRISSLAKSLSIPQLTF